MLWQALSLCWCDLYNILYVLAWSAYPCVATPMLHGCLMCDLRTAAIFIADHTHVHACMLTISHSTLMNINMQHAGKHLA